METNNGSKRIVTIRKKCTEAMAIVIRMESTERSHILLTRMDSELISRRMSLELREQKIQQASNTTHTIQAQVVSVS